MPFLYCEDGAAIHAVVMLFRRRQLFLGVLALCAAPFLALAQVPAYFPPRGDWERRTPEQTGMDPVKLQQAIDFSIAHENPGPKDEALDLKQSFGAREPLWRLLGPTQPRGGMFINAWDFARFGYLFLEHGRWAGREIVSEKWIALARTPGPANPSYGFANWFLNTGRKAFPSTPASSVTFQGNGANIVYLDWDHDLVVVVRWIKGKSLDEFLGKILASINPPAGG